MKFLNLSFLCSDDDVGIFVPRALWALAIWFVTITLGLSEMGAAQEPSYLIESWRTREGLPQNTVLAIEQTKDGYLWIGARGGLARFDGVRFKRFGLADGLKGLDIVDLLDDGNGGLWIGTYGGGVSHWRDGEITSLTTNEGLAHNYVLALAPAGPGAVWIASGGGLQRWGPEGLTQIGPSQGLPAGEVSSLATTSDQGLWIARKSKDSGLYFLRDGRCESVAGPEDHPVVLAHELFVDSRHDLWASIGDGRLLRRRGEQWTEYNTTHGLPISFVYALAEGPGGELWAGTHEEGLYVLREGHFQMVRGVSSSVRAIAMSSDGLVWVGTHTGGLTRLSLQRLQTYPVQGNGQLTGIIEGPSGDFWITTYGGGILKGELDALAPIDVKESAEYAYFLCDVALNSGKLYFGGPGTVIGLDPSVSGWKHVVEGGGMCSALCEGKEDELWIGTRQGQLMQLIDGKPTPVASGEFQMAIQSIVRRPGAGFWIATRGAGLFLWDAGKVRRWGTEEGLPTNVLNHLHLDTHGTLWIGTAGGGLAWLRNNRIHTLESLHSVGVDVITHILEDDGSNLWLGAYRGIVRLSKQELEDVVAGTAAKIHPLVFDESDGVGACNGGYKGSDGTLYFTTMDSVVVIHPGEINDTGSPPAVVIEEMAAAGQIQSLEDKKLFLSPRQNEVSFRFTGFNLAKPRGVQFRYQLVGLTADWVNVDRDRLARFPMLPPGDYTFRVSAANSDRYWSEPASVSFTVRPFFWQTLWFQMLVAALLLSLGALAVAGWARSRVRRAQIREQFALAEAESQQQQNEVAHLTRLATLGELSAALAHELNQPLAAILSNAQAAQRFLADGKADPHEIAEILHDIVVDDERANEVIRRLRSLLRKSEFSPEEVDVNRVLQEALGMMRGDRSSRSISLITDFAEDLPSVRGDRVQLQQVLINLMLNAGDAMDEMPVQDRVLTVRSAREENGKVQISVMDSGRGVDPDRGDRVFEAYHTTKSDGLGLGLSLSRSIVHSHEGRLWFENSVGGGAAFHFTLSPWESDVS